MSETSSHPSQHHDTIPILAAAIIRTCGNAVAHAVLGVAFGPLWINMHFARVRPTQSIRNQSGAHVLSLKLNYLPKKLESPGSAQGHSTLTGDG
jgi:hypothetical protein